MSFSFSGAVGQTRQCVISQQVPGPRSVLGEMVTRPHEGHMGGLAETGPEGGLGGGTYHGAPYLRLAWG